MLLISGDAVIWGKPGYSSLGEKVLNLAFPIITKKEAKWTCGFYRQHIPYLVVLFQSICQVIKNIQCWVSARARGASSWSKLQCEQPCHLAHSSAEARPPWTRGRQGCSLGSVTTLMGKGQFLGFYEYKSPLFFTKYYLEKYSCLRLCSGWGLICVPVQTGRCPGLCIIYSLWGVKSDTHTSTHLHQMEKVSAGLDPRNSWSMRKSREQMSHIHSMTSLGIQPPLPQPTRLISWGVSYD